MADEVSFYWQPNRLSTNRKEWPLWAIFVTWFMGFFMKAWQGAKLEVPTLPESGPAILACNHVSVLDPVMILGSNKKRLVCFIISERYYRMKALNWMFYAGRCIPVKRDGSDARALVKAKELLEQGHVIGVFPEGGIRNRAEKPVEGLGWLVKKTGVPVIPAHIVGAEQKSNDLKTALIRQKPTLRYGEAITFGKDKSRDEITEEVMKALEKL